MDFFHFFVSITLGTSLAAVDPIDLIGKITSKYKLWLHVDAAYGGISCICPENRHYIKGIENVNSFVTNASKSFLIQFDCSLLWIDDRDSLPEALSVVFQPLQTEQAEKKNLFLNIVIGKYHWVEDFVL